MSLQLANPKLESEERSYWHWLLAPDGTPSTVDQAPANESSSSSSAKSKAKTKTNRGDKISVLHKRLPRSSSDTETNRRRSLKRRRTEETFNHHDDDVDDDDDNDDSSRSSTTTTTSSSSNYSISSNSTREDGMTNGCDEAPHMGRRGSGRRLRRRRNDTRGFDDTSLSNGEFHECEGENDASVQMEEIVVATQDDDDDELGWILDGETSVVPMDKTIQMCEEFLNRPSLEGMKNPLTMTNIEHHQARDIPLQRQIMSDPLNRYQHREFQNHDIICIVSPRRGRDRNGDAHDYAQLQLQQLWKIVIAESLIADVLRWYHLVLGPSDDHQRLYDAISTRFYAPNLYEHCYFFRNPDHAFVPPPPPPPPPVNSKSEPPYPVTPPETATMSTSTSTSTASHTSEEHQGVPNEPESPHPVTSESTSTSSHSSSGDENHDVRGEPPRQVRLETVSTTSLMDESENEKGLSSPPPPPQAICEELITRPMGENKDEHETMVEELPRREVTPEKTSTSHSSNKSNESVRKESPRDYVTPETSHYLIAELQSRMETVPSPLSEGRVQMASPPPSDVTAEISSPSPSEATTEISSSSGLE